MAIIFFLVGLCCLRTVAVVAQNSAKITTDLLPVDRATELHLVSWREPQTTQLYCIGSKSIRGLLFDCPTCDVTTRNNLRDFSKDMTESAGYPSVKLNNMPLFADHWKNGQRLQCVGFYTDSIESRVGNVTVDVSVEVKYMKRPTILSEFGNSPPIAESVPNRFYVNDDSPLRLICHVDSNPEPDEYIWLSDKPMNEKTKSLQVTHELIGKTIWCRAKILSLTTEMDSNFVLIETMNGPNFVRSNFESLQNSNVIHPQTNAIPLGTNIELQCSVSGLPKPKIKWFHKNALGNVNAAQCDSSSTTNEEKESNNINWLISSHCNLLLDSFDYFGHYWCSGCIEYAQNLSSCTQSSTILPKEYLILNVTGAPKISERFVPRIEQSFNLDRTTIYVPFCANPTPIESDIYWLINDEKLSIDEHVSNVFAQPIQKDKSHPLCYESPLVFEMPQMSDKYKTFRLFLSNSQGQTNQELSLGRFIVGNDTEDVSSSSYIPTSSYDPLALGIGLAVFIFLFIGLCLCAYLWFTSKACFSFRNAKGKSAKYQSSLTTNHVPTTNENGSEKPANGIENEPQTAETLNGHNAHEDQTYIKSYDDFDLIKETEQIVRPSSEKEKMLPKTKERKFVTDSAV